jgi:NitT/TauT family transport system substrate-binding protein
MATKFLPRMIAIAVVGTSAFFGSLAPTLAADKVTFLTSWFAQAEHGGFYQAKATGLYEKAGLDVTIKMGGPQVNGSQLLLAGETDFMMGYDIQVLKGREQNLPLVTVASSFQFDLQGLMTHDDVADIAALKGKPILIAGPRASPSGPGCAPNTVLPTTRSGPIRSTCSRSLPTRTSPSRPIRRPSRIRRRSRTKK